MPKGLSLSPRGTPESVYRTAAPGRRPRTGGRDTPTADASLQGGGGRGARSLCPRDRGQDKVSGRVMRPGTEEVPARTIGQEVTGTQIAEEATLCLRTDDTN